MLKCRRLILPLVLLFSVATTLSAFAHCLLEHELPSTSGDEISDYISCLETEMSPFLRPHKPGQEMTSFAKMQKKIIASGSVTLVLEPIANSSSSDSPTAVFVPYSIPFYQFYSIYRI